MKYSKLFTKTNPTQKKLDSKNATFLQKAGYIHQEMSGVYTLLPLGKKVIDKIEKIVREEMDKIASEIIMPAIVPRELWEKTNRVNSNDSLLSAVPANEQSKKNNEADYILSPTHEEVITPLVQEFVKSYKDLPVAVYQIQVKFRNEERPKSGLMRLREFIMKDLYSFHKDKNDLMNYYEKSKEAYKKVFERLGIGEVTVIALASGGDFTDNFSHEFQTFCEIGEDTLFYDETTDTYYNREVTPSKAPIKEINEEMLPREDVYGEGIVSVEKLVEFLNIPIEKTVKTLLYKDELNQVYAVAVRGDYDVSEEKLKKVLNVKSIELLSEEEILEKTGAQVGYAGILDLPSDIKIICDEALESMINFEVGANKTNYHTVNANWGRDIQKPEKFYDIKVAKEGDLNPKTSKPYKYFKAAEVGNIFPLEIKFSKAFGFNVADEKGKPEIVYMGCYGIGITRLMGVIAEVKSDDKGLIWPIQIAPFHVHLLNIGNKETKAYKLAEKLYNQLKKEQIEVLWDDRDEAPGKKLNDADLIGIPIRVVVSEKSLSNGGYEVKLRDASSSQILNEDELIKFVKEQVDSIN
jgi:prolyl-tRNA synthetase